MRIVCCKGMGHSGSRTYRHCNNNVVVVGQAKTKEVGPLIMHPDVLCSLKKPG